MTSDVDDLTKLKLNWTESKIPLFGTKTLQFPDTWDRDASDLWHFLICGIYADALDFTQEPSGPSLAR